MDTVWAAPPTSITLTKSRGACVPGYISTSKERRHTVSPSTTADSPGARRSVEVDAVSRVTSAPASITSRATWSRNTGIRRHSRRRTMSTAPVQATATHSDIIGSDEYAPEAPGMMEMTAMATQATAISMKGM